MEEQLEQAARLLRGARRVAVLTGAGISAESGLATFRGAGGLWEGQRVEDVATPRAFERDAALVWRFYNLRRANLATVQPNPGHLALVELENRFGGNFTLVTQNVDGLHQAAGSKNVLEIHGAIRRVRCTGCRRTTDRGVEPLPDLPKCEECGSLLRPDVVWFEEMLPQDVWRQAEEAVGACECFLVIGTSAVVYPAAGLVSWARANRARIIEVNLTATDATSYADAALQGSSGVVLPDLIRRCFGKAAE
ncbi:MAG: NAD-dependent deacylase [Gemmataceae bacterium]|nr:NAD-dependent deacylase [Gemmataceae bacterium]